MQAISRLIDKSGAIGAIANNFSCAGCFPAAASFGAVVGLGFSVNGKGCSYIG